MIRRATDADLPDIRRIQEASPQAAQWLPGNDPTLVADANGVVCGFLTWMDLGAGEVEILNLAVDPAYRRLGIAKQLVLELAQSGIHTIFLEVRYRNTNARRFYQVIGFKELGIREGYYQNPPDSAVVMKWAS